MPASLSRVKKAPGVPSVPTRVVDQVDLHAFALLGDQRIGELATDVVVLEDVGLHVDVVARPADRREHRRVRGRPVLEQRDGVAGGQRRSGNGFLEREVAVEDAGLDTADACRPLRMALLRSADSNRPSAASTCTALRTGIMSGTITGNELQPANQAAASHPNAVAARRRPNPSMSRSCARCRASSFRATNAQCIARAQGSGIRRLPATARRQERRSDSNCAASLTRSGPL